MFPPEFDFNIYKNNNPHLNGKNENELIQHYSFYGYNEGLVSTIIKNRNDFINLIPTNKMILEIGPLCNPCMPVHQSNVHILDYFSKDELIENYKNDLTLIRNEMARRKASGVLTSIKEKELPSIINKNKSEVKEQSEMVTFDPEEYAGPYKVSSNDENDYKSFESDDSLITPLRKI